MNEFNNKKELLKYFSIAKKAQQESDFIKPKIGAAIFYGNKLLSIGYNTNKTSPAQFKYNKYRNFSNNLNITIEHKTHAEIMALNKIKYLDIDFAKCKLFIYRENSEGVLGICKPCPGCEKAIRDLGIKNIFYTGSNSYISERYN